MRCHYVRGFDGERVLIPGCWARAINEFACCICNPGKTRFECLEERVGDLEARLSEYQQLKQEE